MLTTISFVVLIFLALVVRQLYIRGAHPNDNAKLWIYDITFALVLGVSFFLFWGGAIGFF